MPCPISAGHDQAGEDLPRVAGAAEGFPCDGNRVGMSSAGDGQRAPEMSQSTLTVPGMNKPPGRYDVTVRVASDDGHPLPDPAAFAAAASRTASAMNARP